MMKKIILLMCIVLLAATSFSGTEVFAFEQNTFKDIDMHWAEENIETLKNMGVMNGYAGYSNPDSIITRGEFTALITRTFGMEGGKGGKNFSDVKKDHIFYDAVSAAAESGVISGFPDGTFRPDNMITREEIMLIISRLKESLPQNRATFSDISSSYEYISQLTAVTNDGIIKGYPDGSFRPYSNTTRAEAATMIVAAAKKYMPEYDAEKVFEFAYEYLLLHFTDNSKSKSYTAGGALEDIKYIENTYKTAKSLGYSLSNEISDINFLSYTQNGPFTEFTAQYNVKRIINGSEKTYSGRSEIHLITRNGETKVYKHDTQIIVPEFINLTWEVFPYTTPSYATYGVNAVSPTCFRVEAKAEGSSKEIKFGGETLYFNSELSDSYMDYARQNGYEVWAMYKTDFTLSTATKLLNSNEARKQANAILTEEILKNKLDGINFDFENMYQSDKGAYTNHVKEISLMAHTLGAVVSVDITKYEPTSSTWSMCYDRDALAKYADYIMLMAYDQYYAGGKTPGPVAGMSWTESCIKLTLNEVPAERLVLGMPYYIRIWETKNGRAVSSKAVSMDSALRQIDENSAKAEYDARFDLIKYSWENDDKVYMLWLENALSTRTRVQLAEKYSLAGVASWRRGLESRDVWAAIEDEINNN